MDDIKLFEKQNEKRIGDSNIDKDIQPRHRVEFGTEKCATFKIKMYEKTDIGMNRTAKSRKNQKAPRKGNLQVLRYTGHHQTSEDIR